MRVKKRLTTNEKQERSDLCDEIFLKLNIMVIIKRKFTDSISYYQYIGPCVTSLRYFFRPRFEEERKLCLAKASKLSKCMREAEKFARSTWHHVTVFKREPHPEVESTVIDFPAYC